LIADKVALVEGWNHVEVPAGQAGILDRVRMQLEDAAEFAVIITQKELSISALNSRIDPLAAPPANPQRHHISITGAPTGGTFTLSGNSNTTGAIAYNASAGTVQTEVRSLGGAFATSTAYKSGPKSYTVTMPSALDLDVGTNSLTPGSPSLSVTTTGPSAGDGTPWYQKESVVKWLDRRGLLDAWGTPNQPCGYDPSRKTGDDGATDEPPTGLFVERASATYTTGVEPVLHAYLWVGSANVLMPGRVLRNQRTTDF
jgi:hypothetical protein